MVHLSGLEIKENGTGDIEIAYTGLRPGEKLKEQLYDNIDIYPTDHPKIKKTKEKVKDWSPLSDRFMDLAEHIEKRDANKIEKLIKSIVLSYRADDYGASNG